MTKIMALKSWAEQLADLQDPAPKDYDPEDDAGGVPENDSSGDDEETFSDAEEAREHYIDVGKSKLRKPNGVELGPQYLGTSISRDAMNDGVIEDDDEDNPFARDQMEDFSSLGSGSEEVVESDENMPAQLDDEDAFGSDDETGHQEHTLNENQKVRKDRSPSALSEDTSKDRLMPEENDDDLSGEDFEGLSETEDSENSEFDTDGEGEPSMDEGGSETGNMIIETSKKDEDERATVRKMMAEDQQTVAASFSKAAKADIEKGKAIKQQRKTFDNLLNTRIKLQKALVASNSMSAASIDKAEEGDHAASIQAAETAALNLWNSLNDLRSSLHARDNPKKRPFSATRTMPSSELWTEMQSHENHFQPHRRSTLMKWAQKTNPVAAQSHQTKSSITQPLQPLTSVLDQQLSGSSMEKSVARTKIPRSCAPVQAAQKITSDPNIFDDADFYAMLLQELVDQRMASSSHPAAASTNGNANHAAAAIQMPSRSELKVKRQVDTKASKGRKMRYDVQEKLQNFMAPEDRGKWGERQRVELFGSLLGRKIELEEGSDVEMSDGDGEEERAGLRLFGQ